jgi:DNA polymerase IV
VHNWVAHVDVDAFFAAAEVRRRPELAGRPVVVASDHLRSVVAAASYEARRHHIASAMPLARARAACPDLVVVPPDFDYYRELSFEVLAEVAEHSTDVETVALDEAFFSLRGGLGDVGSTLADLRARVYARCRLSVSCGAGSSKLVAKLACEAAKPGGVRVVDRGDERSFVADHRVEALPGVGPVTAGILHDLGLEFAFDVGDLDPAGLELLKRELGTAAATWLVRVARGDDDRSLVIGAMPKSVGSESTFDHDVVDETEFVEAVVAHTREARRRLLLTADGAGCVTVKCRAGGFDAFSRSRTLDRATDDEEILVRVALELAPAAFAASAGRVRLAGVSLGALVEHTQADLFSDVGHDLRWRAGHRCYHDQFGPGVVVVCAHDVAVVRFDTGRRGRVIAISHLVRPR